MLDIVFEAFTVAVEVPLQRLTRGTGAAGPSPAHSEVRPRKSTVPPHRRKAVATEDVVLEQSAKVGSICCLPTWRFTDD